MESRTGRFWGYKSWYLLTGALSPSLIFPLLKSYWGRTEARREFKNTATRTASFITAPQMLREEAELVAPQLSQLLKSALYSYGHDFWKKKTSKCGNHRHGQREQYPTARLPFVWSLEKVSNCLVFRLIEESRGDKICRTELARGASRQPRTFQAALSLLEISHCPLEAAVLNLYTIR